MVSNPSNSSIDSRCIFFFVILEAGILNASSVLGLSIPSCIGLKKNGNLLAIGTTLSVNIFLASEPVLESIPTLASLAKVPVFTHSEDPIKENPERLIFRYDIP